MILITYQDGSTGCEWLPGDRARIKGNASQYIDEDGKNQIVTVGQHCERFNTFVRWQRRNGMWTGARVYWSDLKPCDETVIHGDRFCIISPKPNREGVLDVEEGPIRWRVQRYDPTARRAVRL